MRLLCRRLSVLALVLAGAASLAATVEAATKVERALRDLEQRLCRNISILKCKRQSMKVKQAAATKRRAHARKASPVRAKPVANASAKRKKISARPRRAGIPHEKPIITATIPERSPLPAERPAGIDRLAPLPAAAATTGAACRLRLDTLGAAFKPMTNNPTLGPCQVENPVRLTGVTMAQTKIEFPDSPILSCAFATKFVEWLGEAGAPVLRARAGSTMTRLWTGPGFQCRGRNGDASAKPSEHSFGNAVDITVLKLADGRLIEVKEALAPASKSYAALKELRASACGYFTTVLGPAADEAHWDHFHFDLGRHGKTDSYKICQ